MPVETLPHPEIASLIANCRGLPEEAAQGLASHSLETHRIPDPYYFLVRPNGELFSSTARCRVKDKVEDKTGPLGWFEYQAVLVIEQWAASSDEGSIVWISPPHPGIYPTSKIIISQIEHQDGIKRLFNRAIILDYDEKECLQFAQNLAQLSQNQPLLSHLDQVRATPLVLNTHGNSWMYILQELIDDPALWQSIRTGEDKVAKEKALVQARNVYQSLTNKSLSPEDARVQILGMLGVGSGSCPVVFKSTAFGVFAGFSLLIGSFAESDQYGSLEFECPKCKSINRRPRGRLIPNCQHCSADVRC